MTFEIRIDDEAIAEATGFRNALFAAATIASEEEVEVEVWDTLRERKIATTWICEDGSANHRLSQGIQKFYEEAGQL